MSDLQFRLILAAKDPQLRAEEFRLLVVLHGWLVADEYLPIRVSSLASEAYAAKGGDTDSNRSNVHRALKRLVDFGYLRKGEKRPDPIRG